MTAILRFLKASSRERSIFARALALVVMFRIGLWVLPFGLTREWAVSCPHLSEKDQDETVVAEITRAVMFASKYVPYASCLTQALAARKLLAGYGYAVELKIGVAKSRGDFEAHAWLEMNNRIVLGKQRGHSRYSVLGPAATALRRVR